jgi:lipoyl(octanoyl) transferase 2
VGSDKLAAIGVKLAGGVTTHGIGLNVSTDLGWFAEVVACGIAGAGVTSLERLGAPALEVETVAGWFAAALAEQLGRRQVAAPSAVLEIAADSVGGCRTAV